MGNSQSALASKDVDFKSYTQAAWRSQRSNELDALGGLGRPALALGQSFDAKMQYLGEQLVEQSDKLQEVLSPQKELKEASKRTTPVQGMLHTDRRALERKHQPIVEPTPSEEHRFLSQAEYQQARKAAKAAAVSKAGKLHRPATGPAEWRMRVHRSRRNALLLVKTMLALKRDMPHPKRLMRFSDLSFYIPQLLAEDCGRFVSEQRRYMEIRQGVAASRTELDELLRDAASDVPALPQGSAQPGPAVAAATALTSGPHMLSPGSKGGRIAAVRADAMDVDHDRSSAPNLHSTAAQQRPSSTARRVTFDGEADDGAHSVHHHQSPFMGGLSHASPSKASEQVTTTHGPRSRSAERERSASSLQAGQFPLHTLVEEASQISLRSVRPVPHKAGVAGDQQSPAHGKPPITRPTATDITPTKPAGPEGTPTKRAARSNVGADGERHSSGGGAAAASPVRRPWATSPPVPRTSSLQAARTPTKAADPTRGDAPKAGSLGSAPTQQGAPAQKGGVIILGSQQGPPQTAEQGVAIAGADADSINTEQLNRPVSRYGRMAQIRVELEKQYEQLKKCGKLMGMYVNRVNGAWAEAQHWSAPQLTSKQELEAWCHGDHFNAYKADVIRQLRLGQLAVQLLVGDDNFAVPVRGQGRQAAGRDRGSSGGGSSNAGSSGGAPPAAQEGQASGGVSASGVKQQDLWTSDLWELIQAARPGILPGTARIEGLSYCGRALCSLVLALRAAGGQDAVERCCVLLHVNEEQEEEVADELHTCNCYGLTRGNVMLVVGARHPGFGWDAQDAVFSIESSLAASWVTGTSLAATASGQHPMLAGLGSGADLCQLAWAGEAYSLGEDGTPVPLPVPVLERLESRKVDWVVSRRARDLALLMGRGIVDVPQLAYGMYLRDKLRASCVVEAVHADSAVTARMHDSVLLHRKLMQGTGMPGSPDTSRLVCELRQSEVVSGPVIKTVEALRTAPGGKGLALGLSRYLWHLPTLKNHLTSLAVFRPRLALHRHLLHVSLDMTDLMLQHDRSRALAVEACCAPGLLSSPASLEVLLPLLQAQDHDPAFRDLVLNTVRAGKAALGDMLPTVVSGNLLAKKPGHPIIVFVANNAVAAAAVNMAANLARAGRDSIELVHIVSSELQKRAAEELLSGLKRGAMRSMVDVSTHVLERKSSGLLDCIEQFVTQSTEAAGCRPLVIMGSIQLTSHVFSYMASSVALSAVKRLAGTPVLIMTLNSKMIPQRPGMRYMALVEPHSKHMLSWMVQHLMDYSRGDRLVLSQVQPSLHCTRQQAAATRRHLDAFHSLAFNHQMPVHKAVSGIGPVESVLCSQVEEHGISLLAFQLPSNIRVIPQHLLTMMRSCKGATLIYQDNGMRQSAMRRSLTVQRSVGLMSQAISGTLQQARRALGAAAAMIQAE